MIFLKILTGILIAMVPVGLIIMLTEYGSRFIWTTTVFLGLQALMLFIVIYKISGITSAAISTFIILALSFFIEFLGVNTGYPFGNYTYTSVLQPLIEGVPLTITFAWFSVAVSSYLITADLFKTAGIFSTCFVASVLILASDILLEPFASFVNRFWLWEFDKIPFQNFISWLVLGFLFSLILSFLINPGKFRDSKPLVKRIPYLILAANIITFIIVNFYHGYVIISCIGLIIIITVMLIPTVVKFEA